MNWNQILLTGLLTLNELGFLTFNDPDPDNCKAGTQAIWRAALSDFNGVELKAAFEWATQNWTNKFNQKISPGDLRLFINKNTSLNHGEMFKEIMAKASDATDGYLNTKTGQTERYQFSPLVNEAIKQMGGISSFRNLLIENESTFRAQFRDVVNAINEKDQSKAIVKPVLDTRAALAESVKPQPKAIQAPKAEPDSQGPDPRVLDAFAALKANFQAKGIAKQSAQAQAMKSAAEAVQNALEMMP